VGIGLPWLGAAIIWLAGDRRPRLLHILAVGFSALTALAAWPCWLSPAVRGGPNLSGGVLGDFTLVPDGLGLYCSDCGRGWQPGGALCNRLHARPR